MAAQTLEGNMPWEAIQVDNWLRDGKPELGWRGDPRLWLGVGELVADFSGFSEKAHRWVRKGDVVARQYQVWRHNEDGTDKRLLSRKLGELLDIIPSLITMDPRTPGFVPVMDEIDAHNAKVDAEKEHAIGEAHGAHMDHLWRLVADTQNGKTTFRQMPGRDPSRQM